jgi:hypothetical protein
MALNFPYGRLSIFKEPGLSPQKPTKRAYERNPVAVGKWLHREYPEILYKALKEKALIH